MPHVAKKSSRASELHPGDLVWAKISGFPAWPGQILPDERASPKQLKSKKPGSLFVTFFGDSSHGEFPPTSACFNRNNYCLNMQRGTFPVNWTGLRMSTIGTECNPA
jgi:hypothetical protein